MKIKCKKCGLVWEYKGRREYATCPNCHTKNKVSHSAVEEHETVDYEETRSGGLWSFDKGALLRWGR